MRVTLWADVLNKQFVSSSPFAAAVERLTTHNPFQPS